MAVYPVIIPSKVRDHGCRLSLLCTLEKERKINVLKFKLFLYIFDAWCSFLLAILTKEQMNKKHGNIQKCDFIEKMSRLLFPVRRPVCVSCSRMGRRWETGERGLEKWFPAYERRFHRCVRVFILYPDSIMTSSCSALERVWATCKEKRGDECARFRLWRLEGKGAVSCHPCIGLILNANE